MSRCWFIGEWRDRRSSSRVQCAMLVPAGNSGIKVLVLNANQESQILTEGTELGEIQGVEIVSEEPMIEDHVMSELTEEENDALKKIMETLPPDLTDEQRQKAWELLVEYRTIISTGDYDIGRTDLVEHRIDTGDSRPIR